MSSSGIKGLELALKADKKRAEQAMEKAIYERVGGIVDSMVAEAENGSYQHASYLLDRAFGKARQNIGLDGGTEGAPIVFMPTALIAKFGLDKPIDAEVMAEKAEEPNVYNVPNEDSVSPI